MNPCYELPNPGRSVRKALAHRPSRQIDSTVEEIIETGGQPA